MNGRSRTLSNLTYRGGQVPVVAGQKWFNHFGPPVASLPEHGASRRPPLVSSLVAACASRRFGDRHHRPRGMHGGRPACAERESARRSARDVALSEEDLVPRREELLLQRGGALRPRCEPRPRILRAVHRLLVVEAHALSLERDGGLGERSLDLLRALRGHGARRRTATIRPLHVENRHLGPVQR